MSEESCSAIWAFERMIELRQAGEAASYRVCWLVRGGHRYYRLEIRRADGTIERPVWPLPLPGAQVVEESPFRTARNEGTNEVRQEVLEAAARAAHEANRAFSLAQGAKNLPYWESVPEDVRKVTFKCVLRIAQGDSAREVFEVWARDRFEAGWRRGKTRDPERKLHPNLVDWEELAPVERSREELFASVVRSVLMAFPLSALSERPPQRILEKRGRS